LIFAVIVEQILTAVLRHHIKLLTIFLYDYLKTNQLHAHAETMCDRLCCQNAAAELLEEFQISTSSWCQEGSRDFLSPDETKIHVKTQVIKTEVDG